jgi:DNA polymerase V
MQGDCGLNRGSSCLSYQHHSPHLQRPQPEKLRGKAMLDGVIEGVMLNDIQSESIRQLSLLDDMPVMRSAAESARSKLLDVMDRVNRTAGKGTIHVGSAGIHNAWAMKRNHMTPAYTTRWPELPVARV